MIRWLVHSLAFCTNQLYIRFLNLTRRVRVRLDTKALESQGVNENFDPVAIHPATSARSPTIAQCSEKPRIQGKYSYDTSFEGYILECVPGCHLVASPISTPNA